MNRRRESTRRPGMEGNADRWSLHRAMTAIFLNETGFVYTLHHVKTGFSQKGSLS